jgi:hypothetical protein
MPWAGVRDPGRAGVASAFLKKTSSSSSEPPCDPREVLAEELDVDALLEFIDESASAAPLLRLDLLDLGVSATDDSLEARRAASPSASQELM